MALTPTLPFARTVGEGDRRGRKPRVTDAEILAVFRAANDPVLTVAEIAEQLPIGHRGTYERLTNLEADGMLASKEAGQSAVWWAPKYTSKTTGETE